MSAAPTAEAILALCGSGKIGEAERLLRAARRSPQVAKMLAALCLMQDRYQDAIDALGERAAALDAEAANLQGVCHSLAGRYAQAGACYEAAISADPGYADAYLNAGLTAFLLGRPEEKRLLHQWLRLTGPAIPAGAAAASRARPRLADVTLCCVDTAYHDLAAEALRASLAACDFGDALFLSDRDCHVPGVRHVPVAPIRSTADYSNFMIHRLHEHIGTAFALVIQYDGFVLNGDRWDAAFCGYDYVGAPMRAGERLVVGNGGFSLRSSRLLQALHRDEQVRNYDARRGVSLEDVAISATYRRRLEQAHGIRFAPPELADRFAAGRAPPTRGCFGFHGLVHLVRLHEERFELPETAGEGIAVAFRARSPLGSIAANRVIEVSAPADVWATPAAD